MESYFTSNLTSPNFWNQRWEESHVTDSDFIERNLMLKQKVCFPNTLGDFKGGYLTVINVRSILHSLRRNTTISLNSGAALLLFFFDQITNSFALNYDPL